MIDGQLYKRLAEDQPGMDRWLKLNTAFGAIVAVGLVAMALVGSTRPLVIERTRANYTTAKADGTAIRVQARAASSMRAHDR
jgi:hypothetical protein